MNFKVIVEVPRYEAEQAAKEISAVSTKKISAKKAAELFAQNLIDRYFGVEYLDAEALSNR